MQGPKYAIAATVLTVSLAGAWTHGPAQADPPKNEHTSNAQPSRPEPSGAGLVESDAHSTQARGSDGALRRRGASAAWSQVGRATYYHDGMHGRRTSSGERYDRMELTAAHRTLPLGTWVRVTNLFNWKSIMVRVNDRGPFARGRAIDLSRAAASALGYRVRGMAPVRIELVGPRLATPRATGGSNMDRAAL